MTPGRQRVSLYFVNKDGHVPVCACRDFLIQVKQASDVFGKDTSSSLASARVCNFWGGTYKQFLITGPGTFCFNICRNNSLDTICSAVLIDRLTGPKTYVDDVSLPWLGHVNFNPPTISADILTSAPNAIEQSLKLRDVLDDQSNELSQAPWPESVMAYRAAAAARANETLLENWRWALRLWTPQDRSQFNQSVAQAWQEVEPKWGPLNKKSRFHQ
jgi:hypothetical protein